METFIKKKEPLFNLTITLLVLMLIQSLGGILIPGLYHDSKEVIASWHGNDLITLFFAVPIMLAALLYSQKGSTFAKYTWFAMLFYTFYNNCYYLFGSKINHFFLLYVSIFVLSLISLFILAANYHTLRIDSDFKKSKAMRIVVIFSLMVFGGIMTHMWVSRWIDYVLNGVQPTIPGMIEGYGLVAAMDLSTQIPVMFIGAVLLWKNKALGYLLSFISMISNSVYLLVLVAFCPFAEKAGLEKAWDGLPLFGSLFVMCLISAILFYRNSVTGSNPR